MWRYLLAVPGGERRHVLLTLGSSIAVQRKREASVLTFGKLTLGNVEPGGKEVWGIPWAQWQ